MSSTGEGAEGTLAARIRADPSLGPVLAGLKFAGVFDRGREAAFLEHAIRTARRRLGGLGLPSGDEEVLAALSRAVLSDLLLAFGVLHRDAAACERWNRELAPRLAALARRRGLGPSEATEASADLLADLVAQGSTGPLGGYSGAGSLFSWAATLLLRRIRGRGGAGTVSSHGAGRAEPWDAAADPAEQAAAQELGRALDRALLIGWTALSSAERLVLLGKYRDGCSQKDLAQALGVGEPRISRLLAGAAAKLREQATLICGLAGGDLGLPWAVLARHLEGFLASRSVPTPPTRWKP
jgi:RNA polymerase sigma factor (sigma-70 family)